MKIDAQFTRDLVHDPLNRTALRCFRALVASVGAEILVDFVEHDLGRNALPALGFDLAQDCLLQRPEPVARLAADGSATNTVADAPYAAVFSSGTKAPLLGQRA